MSFASRWSSWCGPAAGYRKRLKALQEDAGTDQPQARSGKDTKQIDKTCLAIGAPPRLRDKAHLRFVASRPCLVCGREVPAMPITCATPNPGPWGAR